MSNREIVIESIERQINSKNGNDEFIQILKYIKKIENDLNNKQIEVKSLKDEIREKNTEIREFDKMIGLKENMSVKEKKKYVQKCENEEKLIEETLKNVNPEIKKEYEEDLAKEDDIIELALQQNQLQFEIHEEFENIKKSIDDKDYEHYKQYKRDFYRLIENFNNIVKPECRETLYNSLVEIIDKEGQVYVIDEKIRNI